MRRYYKEKLAEKSLAKHTIVNFLQLMRNLRNKHALAVVRKACGLTQKELAGLLGVSAITVQRIEQGSLALSEELARKAQEQLDVSSRWLLSGDPSQPPLTPRNTYWSKDLYEFRQGNRFVAVEKNDRAQGYFVNPNVTPPELTSKLT